MSEPLVINWNSLLDVQQEIHRWASEQFPHRTDHHAIYKLMVHEIPEMMTHKKEHGLEGIGTELADCVILLMDLASLWGVDLDDAIYQKMQINYARTWEKDANGIMQHRKPDAAQSGPPFACVSCHKDDNIEELDATLTTDAIALAEGDTHRCTRCHITYDATVPF